MAKRPKPIVLTVLDGWGFRAETKGNAIALARKPNYDELLRKFPNTLIQTSGPSVGLPEGQMGNSEVGHMNIGAGRIVHMDITRIDSLIANKQLEQVPLFQQAMERGRQRQLHFIGLLSDGGVHSHIQHLFALLEMAKKEKVEKVFVHCFMDGRDTPPNSGRDFVRQLLQKMRELGVGEIATVVGRYYAMDRDNRWERVQLAYQALVHGEAETRSNDPVAALQASYEQGVTDEFVKPVVITQGIGPTAQPVGLIRDDDAVIFYNFRADRARQITYALEAPGFDKFVDPKRPQESVFCGHDEIRQELALAEVRDSPGKAGTHLGASVSGTAVQEFALRGDGKVRPRDLLFQWRHRKAVHRRRADSGAVAQGGHVRPETGNVRRGHHGHGGKRDREGRV